MLPADLQEQLNRLRPKGEETERPEAPPILVNGEPVKSLTERTAPDEVDEPEVAPVADGAGTPEADTGLEAIRAKLSEEAENRRAIERELAFVRARQEIPAQPVAPPVDPVAQVMDALRVDEETWATMLADPRHGARAVTEALQRLYLLANQTARAQAVQDIQGVLEQRDAKLTQAQKSETLQAEFWRKHSDLEPYRDTVIGVTAQVAEEQQAAIAQGQRPRSEAEIIDEVGRRTRAALKQYGIELSGGGQPKVASRRIRPASADMGTGSAGRPTEGLTPQQQQMFRLAKRRVA